jgi:hypothetical protein
LLSKKSREEFGNAMWVLQGGNVAENNLMIMDGVLHSLPKKLVKILGM